MQQETPTPVAIRARGRSRRSAPTTSAACCGRRELLQARDDHAAGPDRRRRAARGRGRGDPRGRRASRRRSACGRRPTASSAAPRGTWTSSTSSTASRRKPATSAVKFHNEQGDIEFTPAALHVDGKLGVSQTIFGDAFEFLQETVDDERPEADDPVAEHGPLPRRQGGDRPSRLPDLDAFWADLTAAYREEVRRLGELGCTYLQFDDTSLAYMNDPHQREYVASIGGDPERQHVEYIRHINEALAERPEGMSVTTHMCRGNFRSAWAAEGGYDFVAEALFNELEVDGFFMEWDDERSGGFEPLRFLPKGEKQVVLGLVTTKRGELEPKDELQAPDRGGGAGSRRSSSSASRRSAASPRPSRATR